MNTSEPKGIQRYYVSIEGDTHGADLVVYKDATGEWVKYKDHIDLVNTLRSMIKSMEKLYAESAQ